jgi:outer membrane protein
VSKLSMFWPVVVMSAVAFGQSAPAKVGVINIQQALLGTRDGQRAAQELDTKRAPRAKEFEKRQAEIRQLQDNLNRGGNAMAELAKNNLVRDIDQKTKAFNRDLEDAQAEWDQDQQRVLQDLGQKIMVVIDKYAKDNGFAIILDVSNPQTPVLYASNQIDITNEIIGLYDKNTPAQSSAAPASPAPVGGAAAQPKPAATKPPAPAPAKVK